MQEEIVGVVTDPLIRMGAFLIGVLAVIWWFKIQDRLFDGAVPA